MRDITFAQKCGEEQQVPSWDGHGGKLHERKATNVMAERLSPPAGAATEPSHQKDVLDAAVRDIVNRHTLHVVDWMVRMNIVVVVLICTEARGSLVPALDGRRG